MEYRKIPSINILIAIIAQTTLAAYLMTDGLFDFLRPNEYSLVFSDMWNHLKNGELTISPDVIGPEGFLISGKTYAYQLPFPALIRGFLSLFGLEKSAIISALFANIIFTCSSYLIWSEIYFQFKKSTLKATYYFYTYFLILCSPIIILLSYPRIFTEVILWALALFFTCTYLSVKLLNDKNLSLLPIFALLCGLTLFTRPTFALASTILFFTTLIALSKTKALNQGKWGDYKLSTLIFLIFLIGLGWFNLAKWGNPLEFYPIKYYIMYSGTNLMEEFILAGGANQLNRIPQAFSYYFFPSAENLNLSLPILQLSHPSFFQGIGKFTYDEPAIPISLSLPIYIIFSTAGLFLLLIAIIKGNVVTNKISSLIPGIIGALLLIPPILTLHAKALRYQAELIPLILILSNYFAAHIISQSSQIIHQSKRLFLFRTLTNVVCIAIASTTVLGSIFLAIQSPLLQNTLINKASISSYIERGQLISFSRPIQKGVSGIPFANAGWSEPEVWGMWSDGPESSLTFPPLKNDNPKKLTLNVRALIDRQSPQQRISIWVNGAYSHEVTLKSADDNQIEIPLINSSFDIRQKNLLEKYIFGRPVHSEPLKINLVYKDAHTPSINSPNDKRVLALGLISAYFSVD